MYTAVYNFLREKKSYDKAHSRSDIVLTGPVAPFPVDFAVVDLYKW